MARRSVVIGIAALAGTCAAALAACSLLVPLDEVQCTTSADCASHGAAFAGAVCVSHVCQAAVVEAGADGEADAGTADAADAAPTGPWRCLSDPPEVLDPNARITITLQAIDALQPIATAGGTGGSDITLVSATPFTGVSVHACNALDPTCASPLGPDVVTDDAGGAPITVAGDFTGFFAFNRGNLMPTWFYPGQPLNGVTAAGYPVAMLSKIGVQLLAQAIGVPMNLDPDAGVGHLFITVYDCDDRHATGVTFTINSKGANTVPWYYRSGLPNTTATETDTVGAGGAVNVPAGALVVTATEASSGRVLASLNIVIHSAGDTFAWIRARVH